MTSFHEQNSVRKIAQYSQMAGNSYSGASGSYDLLGIDHNEAADLELGYGLFGVLFRHGKNRALKLPMLFKQADGPIVWNSDFEESANRSNPKVFENEVKVLKILGDHPSLVKVYSCSVQHGIEMELLPNGSLETFLEEKPPGSLEQRLQWSLQIAEGLQYMHEHGVVHTDLALRNVLLDEQSKSKIIDFSNAVIDEEADEQDKLIATMHTDMFDFASAMYSLMTWKVYRLELLDYLLALCAYGEERGNPRGWPTEADLPDVDGVPHGDVVMQCWMRGYDSMNDVAAELRERLRAQRLRNSVATEGAATRLLLTLRRWLFDRCSRLMRFWWRVWAQLRS